jgi:hypothetical protein
MDFMLLVIKSTQALKYLFFVLYGSPNFVVECFHAVKLLSENVACGLRKFQLLLHL